MAPKKLPPRMQQQSQQQSSFSPPGRLPNQDTVTANKPVSRSQIGPTTRQSHGNGISSQNAQQSASQQPQISQQEVKQGSATSAQLALEAGKKAYELRQAAYAAGDPDAREEILGKAINKEIEAEAFGKAAKYTRSGAFQGLAAGAGLGIQPGAVIGQVTGAIVGGLLATVGGLLGGGIGSAYGAIKGPIWDIGAMASHGARGVIQDFIGDFPDFGKSTKHQKDMLEKMVLGAKDTPNPSQSELEQMKNDNGGATQESYQQMAQQMTGYLPSMPSMPDMSKMRQGMPEMPKNLPLVSSLQGLWGQKSGGQDTKLSQNLPVKQAGNTPPKANPSKSAEKSSLNKPRISENKPSPPESKSKCTSQQIKNPNNTHSAAFKNNSSPQDPSTSKTKQTTSNSENPQPTNPAKKAPKLEVRSDKTKPLSTASGGKKAPPKLEQRSKAKPVTA